MTMPPIVSRDEWLTARRALLTKEKELTAARDAVAAQRRRLPMVEITEDYAFEGPSGTVRLLDLFEGRRQLVVYHFMWRFDQNDGCPSCSFVLDNVGHLAHLHARDTSFATVTRGPFAEVEVFRKRMGWDVPMVSSHGSDFNYDFDVSLDPAVKPPVYNYQPLPADSSGEAHGLSTFVRDGSRVFHAYSTYARGAETVVGTYNYLDLTAFGRQEVHEDSLEGWPQASVMSWLRHHDEY
ncbi:DUF899 domain-containing protein [Kibdelosporangium phytohabitans]|uniref:Thioredoxin n=1 Tax=Kibdelosporangium phytohabitans TaxID=860235 RepID=A0A0N9IGC4_9PSEU|nr:DUF899 domain-containing protein [Kibdelosporangium phytohabitans]ALG14393.1 hypothetical protein AOZ06_52720 [Kibdelosporangium phytohabitans]MBE1466569.1 putative dithiol-disulfide oxidoreductase (DUF899 family) [Kibdelosporangium phytohabitans]